MGFMDKMKETATKAGDAAKGAAKAGQDKIEEQKLKKKISDLQEELGGIVYAQRTGAANPASDSSFDASIDRLVAEIKEQEELLAAVGDDADDATGTDEPSDAS